MIFDKTNLLSDHQAVTVTAVSTNVIDFGSAEVGPGTEKQLLIQVTEDFAAAGAATLQVKLQTDADEAFGSAKDLIDFGAIPKATLVAGFQLPIRSLPHGVEKYGRLSYTVATGPMKSGKLKAGIVLDRQTNSAI